MNKSIFQRYMKMDPETAEQKYLLAAMYIIMPVHLVLVGPRQMQQLLPILQIAFI